MGVKCGYSRSGRNVGWGRLKIFGPNGDEVPGEWKKLHAEVLNDLYSSPNIILGDQIEKNEVGGPCSSYGERCMQGFGVKP